MSAWTHLVLHASNEELDLLSRALKEVQEHERRKTLLQAAERLNQKYGVTNRAAADLRRWASERGEPLT